MALIRQIPSDTQNPVDILINFDDCFPIVVDLVLNNGDVATASDLRNMVILSLFCDKRAPADVILDGTELNKRRGWWGDVFPTVDGDEIGSLLWLYARAKITNATLNGMRDTAQESLQWMVDDRIANSIEVVVVRNGMRIDSIIIETKIFRPTGDVTEFKFAYAWEAQGEL